MQSFELMGLSELWACLLKDGDTKQTGRRRRRRRTRRKRRRTRREHAIIS